MRIILLLSFFFSLVCSGQVDGIEFLRRGTYQVSNAPHIAFPSIIRLPNDSLLVVYRKGTEHVDLSGRIMKVKGSADGKFWSIPQILVNEPGVDERDPSIALLSDGRILLNYYEYKPGNATVYPSIPPIYSIHIAFSSDGGNTFSSPQSIDGNDLLSIPMGSSFVGDHYMLSDGSTFQTFGCSSPVIEYGDRIILPAYGGDAVIVDTLPGLIASAPSSIYFFESVDGGVTWNKFSIGENHLTDVWKSEPVLIKLDNGKVLMHYRCADNPSNPSAPGPMRQAYLDLETQDFQPDLEFGFTGQAPALLKLSCGVLVSGFRRVNSTPFSADVCMIYSLDDGLSWSDTIRIFQGNSDCAYPSFSQISPNKLLVTYYTSGGWKINTTIYDFKILLSDAPGISNLDYSGIEEGENFRVSVFPNPCKDFTNISLISTQENILIWRLIDIAGNVVISGETTLSPGQMVMPVSLQDIPAGNYFIELTTDSWHTVEKLVVEG